MVSVLLPVFNAEKYLREAITSVLQQSFRDFELIIINDGSSDKSDEIIRAFKDPRIRYLINEQNIKLIKTLNRGIDEASGKYIARMDADDICMTDRFLRQVEFLEEHKDYVMCGSWARIIDGEGNITGRIKRIDSDGMIRSNMLFTTPFLHPTVMIRTAALKKEKYSDVALHCEDLELWIRLAANGNSKFRNLPYFLLKYRWHTTNVSVQNAEFQSVHRRKLIVPYVEKLIGEMSEEQIDVHFSSYSTTALDPVGRSKAKEWLVHLSQANHEMKLYPKKDLDALLLSRWMVICIRAKRFLSVFSVKIRWYDPIVFARAIRLLIYK